MAYDITRLTNVTDGGSPDLTEAPTSGKLATLIAQIITLSDEIVNMETFLEDPGANNTELFDVGYMIEDDINTIIKQLNSRVLLLQQQTYGSYHAPEIDPSLEAPYYGVDPRIR